MIQPMSDDAWRRSRSRSRERVERSFGAARGRDLKLVCPLPQAPTSPCSAFAVHSVIVSKYFEGTAFETHVQVAEEAAGPGEEVRAVFHGDSPEAWQTLLRIIYLHHEASHERKWRRYSGTESVDFDVNLAIKKADEDEDVEFVKYKRRFYGIPLSGFEAALASEAEADLLSVVPLLAKYDCVRLRVPIGKLLRRGRVVFGDGKFEEGDRDGPWQSFWTVSAAESLSSAKMESVVETWFSSHQVLCARVIEFLVSSFDHEVLSAALHGANLIASRVREEWEMFTAENGNFEGESDFEGWWDWNVDYDSTDYGPNKLSDVRQMLAAIMVDPAKFHGHSGCGSNLGSLAMTLMGGFGFPPEPRCSDPILGPRGIVDVEEFLEMKARVASRC